MRFFVDTNIILPYLKGGDFMRQLDATLAPFSADNQALVSVVSAGELMSLALRNNWGQRRRGQLRLFLDDLIIADINSWDVIQRYAEIEAYSQGKLPGSRSPFSARNMSKNDLWIAATASVLNVPLLTLDKDFDHLHNTYLSVLKAY